MMDEKICIVVEGKEDLCFLEEYLDYLGHTVSSECFKALRGKGKLG